ncbi:MAG: hypothetical protein ISR77_34170, partial [Pirellulaceae bacterium]|nr:hypothetical protein [Pirellulaceae bacterium]
MSRKEILEKLASGELTADQADELLAKEEEAKRTGLYCKVSQKGALSV